MYKIIGKDAPPDHTEQRKKKRTIEYMQSLEAAELHCVAKQHHLFCLLTKPTVLLQV